MQLTKKIDIENDIVTVNIKCTDISDETKETLHDYIKVLCYDDIDFNAKMKLDDSGKPIIVDDSETDADEITLSLVNKTFIVNHLLDINLVIDSKKLNKSECGNYISTIPLLSQAKAILFRDKVCAYIQKLVTEAKKQENGVESEETIVLD